MIVRQHIVWHHDLHYALIGREYTREWIRRCAIIQWLIKPIDRREGMSHTSQIDGFVIKFNGLSNIWLQKLWMLVSFGPIHGSTWIVEDDIIFIYATKDELSGRGREKVPMRKESFSSPTPTCWSECRVSPTSETLQVTWESEVKMASW